MTFIPTNPHGSINQQIIHDDIVKQQTHDEAIRRLLITNVPNIDCQIFGTTVHHWMQQDIEEGQNPFQSIDTGNHLSIFIYYYIQEQEKTYAALRELREYIDLAIPTHTPRAEIPNFFQLPKHLIFSPLAEAYASGIEEALQQFPQPPPLQTLNYPQNSHILRQQPPTLPPTTLRNNQNLPHQLTPIKMPTPKQNQC